MDLAGLGVDIIEIERMKRCLEKSPRFKMRVFSAGEREYCDAKARPEVHYALRFAAKEAVLKALGIGFGCGINVTDVEVVTGKGGKPIPVLHGVAADIAKEQGVIELHLSLSFTHTVGVASAVAVTENNRPKVDKQIDPRAELAVAFKEARSLLDDLDGVGFDSNDTSKGDMSKSDTSKSDTEAGE